MKAAIIGMGVVGRAQAALFGEHVRLTYDIADGTPWPEDEIAACDFAVICVGTPAAPDGSCDLSQVREVFSALPLGMPALIRSTVPPGTTRRLQGRHEGPVAHAPEFMHERDGGPWPAPAKVPWMVLGGTPAARMFFRPPLEKVFPSPIHECDALTAELAKYTANLYWAARVTFVSEMAAVCEAAGADWEEVRAAWLEDTRVNPAYTAMAGFEPGFGGRCWPKDLSALIAAAAENDYDPAFLRAVRAANRRFRPA